MALRPCAMCKSRFASTGCGGTFIERSILTGCEMLSCVRAVVSDTKVPATLEPAARDIRSQRIDDAGESRAGPLRKCRDPIHAIPYIVLVCMDRCDYCMDQSRSRSFAMRNAEQTVSLTKALWRGFTMRCPNCGEGKLFGRFLKVVDHCAVCGEDFTPQRADDFPAYLVIVVIGDRK